MIKLNKYALSLVFFVSTSLACSLYLYFIGQQWSHVEPAVVYLLLPTLSAAVCSIVMLFFLGKKKTGWLQMGFQVFVIFVVSIVGWLLTIRAVVPLAKNGVLFYGSNWVFLLWQNCIILSCITCIIWLLARTLHKEMPKSNVLN
jgi:hypothetical protein